MNPTSTMIRNTARLTHTILAPAGVEYINETDIPITKLITDIITEHIITVL